MMPLNWKLFVAALIFISLAREVISTQYGSLCDSVFCRILSKSNEKIANLKSNIDKGALVEQFGAQADEICNSALEQFAMEAPIPETSEVESEEIYDHKVEELEKTLDASLQALYYRQLSMIVQKALDTFKQSLASSSDGTEFEAMVAADEMFRKLATESTRQSPEWTFIKEAAFLKSALHEISSRQKMVHQERLNSAKQSQQAMDYLRSQQQQLQAMQQQLFGQSSPWNCALAYRIPDTNINLQGSYQQGRGNIQISCVPDESISLLGPNGFVHGVTPGNIGISFNVNI